MVLEKPRRVTHIVDTKWFQQLLGSLITYTNRDHINFPYTQAQLEKIFEEVAGYMTSSSGLPQYDNEVVLNSHYPETQPISVLLTKNDSQDSVYLSAKICGTLIIRQVETTDRGDSKYTHSFVAYKTRPSI